MNRKKLIIIFLILVVTTSIVSCVPTAYSSPRAGFFYGLWHGFIILFSLIGKLLGFEVGIYASNNTGAMYWLGFIIGIFGFGGGGTAARR
jgi:hypothetical protein